MNVTSSSPQISPHMLSLVGFRVVYLYPDIYSSGSRLISVYPVAYLLQPSNLPFLLPPVASRLVHRAFQPTLSNPVPFLPYWSPYLGLWNPNPTGQCGCPLLDHCFIPLWSDPVP